MLSAKIPKRALDASLDNSLVEFKALSVFYYHNLHNEYKQWYIIHVPEDPSNWNWKDDPMDLEQLLPIEPKQLITNSDDLWISCPHAMLHFCQISPFPGPAYERERKRLMNLSTMQFQSAVESFTPYVDKQIILPYRIEQ